MVESGKRLPAGSQISICTAESSESVWVVVKLQWEALNVQSCPMPMGRSPCLPKHPCREVVGHVKMVHECDSFEPKTLKVAEAINFDICLILKSWLGAFYFIFFSSRWDWVGSQCSLVTRIPAALGKAAALLFFLLCQDCAITCVSGDPLRFSLFFRWLLGCIVESTSNFLILKIEAPLNKQVDECVIRIEVWDFLNGSNCFVIRSPSCDLFLY